MDIKKKLVSTFETIQFESEMLVSSLATKIQEEQESSKQLVELKKEVMVRLSKRLKHIQSELLNFHSTDDIDLYLDAVSLENKDFVKTVKTKIKEAEEGNDIMDYVFHLKEENGDLFHRLSQKAKPAIENFTENETVQELSDKAKDFIEDKKPQIEKIQSKVNEIVVSIKERVGK